MGGAGVPSVTAILSSWRRPHLLADQLRTIRAQSAPPDQIWVWADACPENQGFDYTGLGIDRVFHSSSNNGVYGRFAAGLLARTALVLIIDDDAFPGRRYIENASGVVVDHGGIAVAAGVVFTTPRYRPCLRFGWPSGTPRVVEVDSGCQSWLLRREWISFLWREPPFNWSNGEDMQLSYSAKKYGNVRTYTPAQPDPELSGSTRPELGWDDVAVSARADHYDVRTAQLVHQLALGWTTVRGVQLGETCGSES